MYERLGRVAATAATVVSCVILCAGAAQAATITVNSLADDVFPDGAGAIFDSNDLPIVLASPKCTLRMAMSTANLNVAVGGPTFGCTAGTAGADTIVFDAALNLANVPGTIMLANKGMSEAPAVFAPPLPHNPPLFATTPMTITGPGSGKLTIDGSVAAIAGRRMFGVADANGSVAFQFNLSGVRLLRGRVVDGGGACLAGSEHVTVTDVVFESCEAVSGESESGNGGAINVGVDTSAPGNVRPNIVIAGSTFIGNRGTHGSSPIRSEAGAVRLGGNGDGVGTVSITNSVFNGNSADTRGALVIGDATSVLIDGSHFIANAATGSAAAGTSGRNGGFLVAGVSGPVTVTNSRINGNVANEERAGFGIQSVDGTVTISEVDVTGNYVNRGRIGGFEVLTDTFDAGGNCQGLQLRPVNVSNVRVQGNSVASNTGGFRVICSGAVTMTDVEVRGNETRGYRLTQTDVVSTANSAGQLAAGHPGPAAQSTATLTRVLIENNSTETTGAGGGGFNVLTVAGLGAFTADSIRVRNNFAAASGILTLNGQGAGRNYLITNSEFAGNKAHDLAALFMETDGNYTLRNSTVSGNATTGGGSIVKVNANTNVAGGVSVAIEHSTIARNTANFEEAFGAGVWANPTLFGGANAVITIKNSILGTRSPGFTGTNTVGFDASVTNVTTTHSLLEWNGGAPAGFCAGAGMKCNVGSLVTPLANNGGTGTRTMALLAGSPAINAGGAVLGGLTTDQRGAGFPRVIGGTVDMGAYESDPATTVGCTLDLDGNGGQPDALTDGLLLMRALFGLTGTAVTNGAVGGSATRPDWTAIRNYLNANCGSSFAP